MSRSSTPPTWRELAGRARQLGKTLDRSPGRASLVGHLYVESYSGVRLGDLILRAAVAASLKQMEGTR